MSAAPILEARGLRKDFNGFAAVDGVDLQVRPGAVHAIVGPNGAGKTTLFNLLTRFLPPSSGSTHFKGRDITRLSPAAFARLGMVRSFQISALFHGMSAIDNVRLARQRRRLGADYRFWRSERLLRSLDADCMALLEEVGLAGHAETVAGELPYGQKRALELATTLALDPEVLLLDEPTAGMTQADIQRVTQLVGRIARTRTVVMIEHNLRVVAELSDRITVLERGRVLAEGSYGEVSRDPAVIRAYLGGSHA